MTEKFVDSTRESLFSLWEELNENPRLAHGSLINDVWERLCELDHQKVKVELKVLRDELNAKTGV